MCTAVRFSDDKGNLYMGRNLDWSFSFGQFVVITPRGFQYASPFRGQETPKHGAVIGMALTDNDTPLYFDCANESGLAVAGLNFDNYAQYEKAPVDGKTNVAVYEFPLWVTMNFATVDEVEAALKDVAIVAHAVSSQYAVNFLHWIIGDGKRSIVVEYTERGMEVFHNDVDVLANQPDYHWHQENLRNYLNLSNDRPKDVKWGASAGMNPFGSGGDLHGIPGDYSSPSRFVRVAFLNTHYPTKDNEAENVSRLFHTLAGVSMIDGIAAMPDDNSQHEITTYTGGYSSAAKTYYYNTYDNPAIRSVSMSDYDLDSHELISVKQ